MESAFKFKQSLDSQSLQAKPFLGTIKKSHVNNCQTLGMITYQICGF